MLSHRGRFHCSLNIVSEFPSHFALGSIRRLYWPHISRPTISDATSALHRFSPTCHVWLSRCLLVLDALIRRHLHVYIIRDGHPSATAAPTSVASDSLRCGLNSLPLLLPRALCNTVLMSPVDAANTSHVEPLTVPPGSGYPHVAVLSFLRDVCPST